MKLAALVLLSSATAIAGPKLPPGFEIVEQSRSPDGKLAVIAPDLDHVKAGTRQNAIVEVATGKTIATIEADTTAVHENHADMAPKWEKDGANAAWLLWQVDGKWGTTALVLVHVEKGAVTKQLELREPAVQRILAEAKRADPRKYEAAKKNGKGNGAWFRDGFAVQVVPESDAKIALPMKLAIDLTSNPRGDSGFPKDAELSGRLSATVDASGALKFGAFVVTPTTHDQ